MQICERSAQRADTTTSFLPMRPMRSTTDALSFFSIPDAEVPYPQQMLVAHLFGADGRRIQCEPLSVTPEMRSSEGFVIQFPTATTSWGVVEEMILYDETGTIMYQSRFANCPYIAMGDTLKIHMHY